MKSQSNSHQGMICGCESCIKLKGGASDTSLGSSASSQSELKEILDKFYILRAASGFDLEEVKRRNKAGESEPELKTALLSLALSCLPEKTSLEDLDPKEKINRVEYAKFCSIRNAAIDTMEQQIRAKFQ